MSEQRDQQLEASQETSSSAASRRKKGTGSSDESQSRRSVHIVLQGKGGVGKTLTASLIAQWMMESGEPVVCVDVDPVQQSFALISALNATPVDLLEDDSVNVPEMDALVDRLATEDSNFVIDCGAASFVPMSSYLIKSDVIPFLTEAGKRFIIHTIIVGGSSLDDTAIAARDIATQFPASAEIVAWLNPFFGRLDAFEDTEIFKDIAKRLAGIVRLPKLDQNYSGRSVMAMLDRHMTFAEARASEEFTLMARLRLANVWEPLKEQIAAVC